MTPSLEILPIHLIDHIINFASVDPVALLTLSLVNRRWHRRLAEADGLLCYLHKPTGNEPTLTVELLQNGLEEAKGREDLIMHHLSVNEYTNGIKTIKDMLSQPCDRETLTACHSLLCTFDPNTSLGNPVLLVRGSLRDLKERVQQGRIQQENRETLRQYACSRSFTMPGPGPAVLPFNWKTWVVLPFVYFAISGETPVIPFPQTSPTTWNWKLWMIMVILCGFATLLIQETNTVIRRIIHRDNIHPIKWSRVWRAGGVWKQRAGAKAIIDLMMFGVFAGMYFYAITGILRLCNWSQLAFASVKNDI